MLVIFGWDKKIKPIKPILDTYCYHCSNESSWDLYSETDWISLFFIPVLPVYRKHHLMCSICGNKVHLDKSKAQTIDSMDSMDRDDNKKELYKAIVSLVENNQLADKTETQRNFIRASKELAREKATKRRL